MKLETSGYLVQYIEGGIDRTEEVEPIQGGFLLPPPAFVRRSWRERLLSWPWRPWQTHRWRDIYAELQAIIRPPQEK